PPPRPRETWTFEGQVYDILTLRPVFGATLKFEAQSGETAEAETDERGRYQAKVPALKVGSYSVQVEHSDSIRRYFDEIDPPFRELELAERKALQKLVARQRPWLGAKGRKQRRDLVLGPPLHTIQMTDGPAP
ncbi:MAG: carboxypeptidase regulatory-like domain-containing protein, partial [Elusimicrobia bacterium]|nr:carboxypeptidase regulatory-like domain-containing protein [Elusimicrobiota bacterium]